MAPPLDWNQMHFFAVALMMVHGAWQICTMLGNTYVILKISCGKQLRPFAIYKWMVGGSTCSTLSVCNICLIFNREWRLDFALSVWSFTLDCGTINKRGVSHQVCGACDAGEHTGCILLQKLVCGMRSMRVVVQRVTQYSILINNVRAMQPAAISLSREITSLWWQAAQQSTVEKICTTWSAIAQL
jgi:hypothetical protein